MGSEITGLLVDFGGVLTTSLFDSFGAFCISEGLDRDELAKGFAANPQLRELLIGLEIGQLTEEEFEPPLAAALGVDPAGLIDRLFAGSGPDTEMVEAVRTARRAGIKTGLISNSWGTRRYDRVLLAELFDGLVISGEEGLRKPAPEMYIRGAERVGLEPSACVFVDDLVFNLDPARELGMATVHHVTAAQTIGELEPLLGVALR